MGEEGKGGSEREREDDGTVVGGWNAREVFTDETPRYTPRRWHAARVLGGSRLVGESSKNHNAHPSFHIKQHVGCAARQLRRLGRGQPVTDNVASRVGRRVAKVLYMLKYRKAAAGSGFEYVVFKFVGSSWAARARIGE